LGIFNNLPTCIHLVLNACSRSVLKDCTRIQNFVEQEEKNFVNKRVLDLRLKGGPHATYESFFFCRLEFPEVKCKQTLEFGRLASLNFNRIEFCSLSYNILLPFTFLSSGVGGIFYPLRSLMRTITCFTDGFRYFFSYNCGFKTISTT